MVKFYGEEKAKIIIATLALAVSACFLFWNLGCYSLWDDECATALGSKGVLRSGDTSAEVGGGNILAFSDGAELIGTRIRSHPPLPYYITAGSFALFGVNSWAARMPYALCGLLTVALMLWWARRERLLFFGVMTLAIVGNVSFFLYSRNCRYYALAMLLAVATAWFYWHWRGQKRRLAGFAVCSVLIFATHYSAYITVMSAIIFDYLIWRRREIALTAKDWLIVSIPQIIGCGVLVSIWNPLRTSFGDWQARNGVFDRLQMFWWHLRDLNTLEFLSWPVVIAALILGGILWRLNRKIQPSSQGRGSVALALRASVAIVVAVATVAASTSQLRALTKVADMRYLICVLPLSIALTAWAVCYLSRGKAFLAVPLAVLVLFSNLTHGGMFFNYCSARSTLLCFINELRHPTNADPFAPTAKWIRENVADGASIYVAPNYNTYSLMFLAPSALYAWQFEPEKRKNSLYCDLPLLHFKGEVLPDYLIGFGPYVGKLQQDIRHYWHQKAHYELVAKIDVYWQQLYRPELFWRSFNSISGYDQNRDVVFIFKRVDASEK